MSAPHSQNSTTSLGSTTSRRMRVQIHELVKTFHNQTVTHVFKQNEVGSGICFILSRGDGGGRREEGGLSVFSVSLVATNSKLFEDLLTI